jgi:hypothetical protein
LNVKEAQIREVLVETGDVGAALSSSFLRVIGDSSNSARKWAVVSIHNDCGDIRLEAGECSCLNPFR